MPGSRHDPRGADSSTDFPPPARPPGQDRPPQARGREAPAARRSHSQAQRVPRRAPLPQRRADRRQQLPRRPRVVGGGVRQDDRVRLGMRQPERAAEHMAELVMQRHAGATQHRTAEPGASERPGAGIEVAGTPGQHRQRLGHRRDRLGGEQAEHRIAIAGVKPLDSMGERIQPRIRGQPRRKAQRQRHVVDHRLRPDRRVAAGRLPAIGRLAEDVGHLGAGVCRRHHHLVGAGAQRDRLAEPDGRPSAQRYHAVGSGSGIGRERRVGHPDRRMGLGPGEDAGGAGPEISRQPLRSRAVAGSRQHQRPTASQAGHLRPDFGERSLPKDHPSGKAGESKAVDGHGHLARPAIGRGPSDTRSARW